MSYKSNKKGTIDSRPEFEFVYVRHSFFSILSTINDQHSLY